MKLILNDKQKFLMGTAYRILVADFDIPPDKTKILIFTMLVKELRARNTTLEALDQVSRADRHIFIRRVANLIGEDLISQYGIKANLVNDSISKFMKIMHEQSQLSRM
jgi:hypothetical protein